MNRKLIFFIGLIGIAVLVLLVFFSKKGKQHFPEGKPQPPELMIAISLNDQSDARVPKGWPVVVKASVMASPGKKFSAQHQDGWGKLLQIEVQDALGKTQPWPFEKGKTVLPAGPKLDLEEMKTAQAFWVLSSKEAEGIQSGMYTLHIYFGGKDKPQGIGGPSRLEILKNADGMEKYGKDLAEAKAALALENFTAASAALETLLKSEPYHEEALILKAEVIEKSGGSVRGQFDAYNEIINAYPESEHIPEELTRKRHDLMVQVLKEENQKFQNEKQ